MTQAEELKKLRNRITNLEASHTNLKKKNKQLLSVAKEILAENKALWKETNFLRAQLNCSHYHCDSVEQYGRRENAEWHEITEMDNEKESDVVQAVVDRANYVLSKSEHYKNTTVDASDIQRCHRVGKRKNSNDPKSPPKPRKIICRFKCYKLRQKIIMSKRHLKSHTSFHSSFITENLTPFRSKLLWYVKKKCDGRFVNVHTRDSNIKAQLNNAKDKDDDWITITSPDDLFKYDIKVDMSLINEKYFSFSSASSN